MKITPSISLSLRASAMISCFLACAIYASSFKSPSANTTTVITLLSVYPLASFIAFILLKRQAKEEIKGDEVLLYALATIVPFIFPVLYSFGQL